MGVNVQIFSVALLPSLSDSIIRSSGMFMMLSPSPSSMVALQFPLWHWCFPLLPWSDSIFLHSLYFFYFFTGGTNSKALHTSLEEIFSPNYQIRVEFRLFSATISTKDVMGTIGYFGLTARHVKRLRKN